GRRRRGHEWRRRGRGGARRDTRGRRRWRRRDRRGGRWRRGDGRRGGRRRRRAAAGHVRQGDVVAVARHVADAVEGGTDGEYGSLREAGEGAHDRIRPVVDDDVEGIADDGGETLEDAERAPGEVHRAVHRHAVEGHGGDQ